MSEGVQKYSVQHVLDSLGPVGLARIGSVYNRWKIFNEGLEGDKKISYAQWCDSYTRIDEVIQDLHEERKRITQLENENDKLRDEVESLKDSVVYVRQLIRQLEDHATKSKIAPKSEEFEAFRMTMYRFNKNNSRRSEEDKLKFGVDNKIDIVKSLSNLREFLASPHAVKLGARTDAVEYFSVHEKDGSLVTLDQSFRGGIGFAALWIPENKYKLLPSEDWADENAILKDPRRDFIDPGTSKLWIPPIGNKRKISEI